MAEFNLWAVLAATVASFAFGALWYSPLLFLKRWCAESGVELGKGPANPARVYGLTFVFTLLSAALLGAWITGSPGPVVGGLRGLLAGLCFAAASMGINYQFAGRSFTVWFIDGGFHTVRFALMGAILGTWPT